MQEQMSHFLSSYSKPIVFLCCLFSPFCIFQTLLFSFTMSYKLGSSVNTRFKCILVGLTDQGLLDWPQASNKHPHIFSITKQHMEQNRRKNRKSKRKFIGQANSSLISEKKKPTSDAQVVLHYPPQVEQCPAMPEQWQPQLAKPPNFYFWSWC